MHIPDVIIRHFGERAFLLHKRSRRGMFIDGPLAPFAAAVAADPDAVLDDKFVRDYPAEAHDVVRVDAEELRNAICDLGTPLRGSGSTTDADEPTAYDRLHTYALHARQVTTVDIELTYRCNLRCDWCFLDRYDEAGLPTDVLIRLGEQLRDAGVIFASFTGGEPFLRNDLEEILHAYDSFGMACEVKTNATQLTRARIERLALLPLFDVQVSVYGPDATTASLTHGRYSSEAVGDTVRHLSAAGLPVSLSVLVGSHNIDTLDAVHVMVSELAPVYYNPYITPRRGGDGPARDLRLSARDLREKFAPFLARIGQHERPSRYRDCAADDILCSAGRTQLAVSPDGWVSPCLELPWRFGNIMNAPLTSVLACRDAVIGKLRPSSVPTCRDCDVRDFCDSCVGVAITANGTMSQPWSHRCDIARFAATERG